MQSAPQQLPPANPNLALFAQMMAQQYGIPPQNLAQNSGQPPQGGPPGMPPQGAPGMPPGGPPQQGGMPPPGMPPGAPMGTQQPGGQPPMMPPGPKKFSPQEMAGMGRLGDNSIAHMTKGEIGVPPQVQTPKVLAVLKEAFRQKHAPMQNFIAGSPTQQVNPSTGAPEMSFWSSFLPIALGIGGSLIAPGIGTALGSSLGGAALGGIGAAAGTGLGDIATGHGMLQSALAAGGAGLGGYFAGGGSLSGLTGGGSQAASQGAQAMANPASGQLMNQAQQAASQPFSNPMGALSPAQELGQTMSSSPEGMAGMMGQSPYSAALGAQQAAAPGLNSLYGALPGGATLSGAAGGAAGGMLGNQFGAPTPSTGPVYPPGFTNPAPSVGSLPSAQEQLGMTNSKQPAPNFNGYNPATNFPAAYNFFPQNPNMTQPVSVTS